MVAFSSHDRNGYEIGFHRLGLWTVTACMAMVCATPSNAQMTEIPADAVPSPSGEDNAVEWQIVDGSQLVEVASTPAEQPNAAFIPWSWKSIAVPSRYAAIIDRAAASAGISPALLSALVWQESRFNARAVSPSGAVGLAQLMPATARELGVDPWDPAANVQGGARYLRRLLNTFDGNVEKALAAYNAGPARVRIANGVPPIAETRAYVASIVQNAAFFGTGIEKRKLR